MPVKNLFQDVPADLPEEYFELLAQGEGLRIERIVSKGHKSKPGKWYDQDFNEWVTLLQGKAKLQFAGEEEIEMLPGDYVLIPSHTKHRVSWTKENEETVWLAVYFASSGGGT